jgi:DNA-binding NarL/FixJ family response regulator
MKPRHVLVANHHDLLRPLIFDFLRERFPIVQIVGDGEQLVRSAKYLPPDVIVSEVFMPGMTGLSVRDELLALGVSVPFVFLSTMGKEIVEFVPADAIVAFVYKVDMLGHLANAIEAVHAGQRYLSPFYRG